VWIGGEDGTLLRTRDHGRSFERASLGEWVVGIWGAGPDDVWVIGERHIHRVEHGATLATLSIEGWRFSGVSGTSARDVWIGSSPIVHTADGGATWSLAAPTGPTKSAGEILATSPLDVWATIPFNVVHSTDGGKSWSTPPGAISVEDDIHLRGSASDVWVVGHTSGPSRSTDGGATWHEDGPQPAPGVSRQAFYGDMWSAGGGWAWVITLDGIWVRPGRTPWVRTSLDAHGVVAVWASGPGDLWAVGEEGRILHCP
jgi:photosystem II stability/assembly factor-like uncharacterized protein